MSNNSFKIMSPVTDKKTFRIESDLMAEFTKVADEKHTSVTQLLHEAMELYKNKYYLNTNATMISEDIVRMVSASNELLEKKLNARSNQLLSSMAMELFIIQRTLGENLEVSPDTLERYRREAAEFLQTNNRVFRLEEGL